MNYDFKRVQYNIAILHLQTKNAIKVQKNAFLIFYFLAKQGSRLSWLNLNMWLAGFSSNYRPAEKMEGGKKKANQISLTWLLVQVAGIKFRTSSIALTTHS